MSFWGQKWKLTKDLRLIKRHLKDAFTQSGCVATMLNDLTHFPPSCVALQEDEACGPQSIALYSDAGRPLNSERAEGLNLDEQVVGSWQPGRTEARDTYYLPRSFSQLASGHLPSPLMLTLLSVVSGPSSHHSCLETTSILITEETLGLAQHSVWWVCVGELKKMNMCSGASADFPTFRYHHHTLPFWLL